MGHGSVRGDAITDRDAEARPTTRFGPPRPLASSPPERGAGAGGPGGARRSAPPGDTRERRVLPLVVWILALLAGTVLFHLLGDGPLEAPPLDPGAFGDWAAQRDPLIATVAVLRLVVLALSWYLVGVTSIGLLARLLRAARLVRVADALTVPLVRRLLQQALGVSLATAMVAASTPASTASTVTLRPDEPSAVTMTVAPTEPGAVTAEPHPGPGPDVTAPARPDLGPDAGADVEVEPGELRPEGLRLLQDAAADPAAADPAAADPAAADPAAADPAAADAIDADPADHRDRGGHTVVAGESLWSIAATTLAQARGTDATALPEAEIADYWRAVVAANAAELADPDNPDLIFPGQQVQLPEVDS